MKNFFGFEKKAEFLKSRKTFLDLKKKLNFLSPEFLFSQRLW